MASNPVLAALDVRAMLATMSTLARNWQDRVDHGLSVTALNVIMMCEKTVPAGNGETRQRNVGPLADDVIADLRSCNLTVTVMQSGEAVVSW